MTVSTGQIPLSMPTIRPARMEARMVLAQIGDLVAIGQCIEQGLAAGGLFGLKGGDVVAAERV